MDPQKVILYNKYIEMYVYVPTKMVLYDRWSLITEVLKHRFHCTRDNNLYILNIHIVLCRQQSTWPIVPHLNQTHIWFNSPWQNLISGVFLGFKKRCLYGTMFYMVCGEQLFNIDKHILQRRFANYNTSHIAKLRIQAFCIAKKYYKCIISIFAYF